MALTDLIPFRKGRRENDLPVRRDAANPFLRLQEEMNRLFDDFLPGRRERFDWPELSGAGWDFVPGVDVKETKKNIQVTAELPGVSPDDVEVRLDGNTLTIRGEKREEKTDKDGGWTHCECRYGSFMWSLPLGVDVDPAKVEATFKNGVLKVTLPKTKPTAADANRIEVKAG